MTVPRRPPQQSGPHGESEVRRLGLLTALYFWNASFGPPAMGPSQSSGYGSTRVKTRPHGDACRLEARTRGSTWATGASSASGARGRMARLCASSARGQTSLVTGTAVTTISPGAFSSNSFTSADNRATDRTPLSPRGIGVSSAGDGSGRREPSAPGRGAGRVVSQDWWRPDRRIRVGSRPHHWSRGGFALRPASDWRLPGNSRLLRSRLRNAQGCRFHGLALEALGKRCMRRDLIATENGRGHDSPHLRT